MSRILFFLSAFLVVAVPAAAAPTTPARDALLERIGETEHSLRHSSVAGRIDEARRARSIRLLDDARQAVADGHLKTARELLRQAAAPLAAMSNGPATARDSGNARRTAELRAALESISDGAAAIATSPAEADRVRTATRQAIDRSRALERRGKTGAALTVLRDRYLTVQATVAGWRDGKEFVVRTPDARDAAQWPDALRRIEERRLMTEALIAEAQAEGIDTAALHQALAAAESSVVQATGLAGAARWDQAYRTIDLAYAQIETSWRSIGIEW